MRGDYVRVFISSKMQGEAFRRERAAVARAIESLPALRAWYWERDAHAGPYCTHELCVSTARTSDGLVLLVGDEITDITRDEFFAAYAAGAPCFIFVDSRQKQIPETTAFIRSHWPHAVTKNFGSTKELAAHVRLALTSFGRTNWRNRLLDLRARRAEEVRHELRLAEAVDADNASTATLDELDLEVVDHAGESRPVSSIIAEAHDAAAKGLHHRVFEALWELADWTQEVGLAGASLSLLDELRRLIGGQLDAEQQAWVANSEGISFGHLGRRDEAELRFLEMEEIGRNLGDSDIVSTALQNLAGCAIDRDDLRRATELSREALALKLELDDYFGAAQVVTNLMQAALDVATRGATTRLIEAVEEVARAAGEPGLLSTVEGTRGMLAARNGDVEAARSHFRRSLALARKSGNLGREANAMINVALGERDAGRPDAALRWHRKGLALAESIGDVNSIYRHNVGAALAGRSLDRMEEAASYFDGARQAAATMGDRAGWAGATADMAACEAAFDVDETERHLGEALEVFASIGDREWQRRILRNWASLARKQGNPAVALEKLGDALDLLPADAHAERAELYAGQADAASAAGSLDAASSLVQKQLDELRRASLSRAEMAWEVATAAAALSEAGADDEAVPLWEEAVAMYQRLRDTELLYHVRNDLANSLARLGHADDALRQISRCRVLARNIGSPALQLQTEMNCVEILRRSGDLKEAIRTARAALSSAVARRRGTDIAELRGFILSNLGRALVQAGRVDDSEAALRGAKEIAREIRARDLEASAVSGLGNVAFIAGRYVEAARLYQRAVRLRTDSAAPEQMEELGAVVVAFSAAAKRDDAERSAQRLVDAAQEASCELAAASSLCEAARWWLATDVERAADLYAVAALLATAHGARVESATAAVDRQNDSGSGTTRPEDEDLVDTVLSVAEILAMAAIHAHMESPKVARALKRELPRALSRQHRGAGKWLADLIRAAWDSAAALDLDDPDREAPAHSRATASNGHRAGRRRSTRQ
jgi:tetratricopeptide (TPR) repeat protein